MSGKTEQPTPRRLREARRKGQVPRSRLLNAGAVLLGGLGGLVAGAPGGAARLRDWTVRLLAEGAPAEAALADGVRVLLALAAPALAGALLAALGVTLATVGLEPRLGHVLPRLERLDPAAGLRRLLGAAPWGEAARALGVALVLLALAWREGAALAPDALRTSWLAGREALPWLLDRVGGGVLRLAAVLVALGGADYAWARWRHRRALRMTREEVRREHRESEGDPHHKAHRRALHRQLSAGGPARGVHEATAVVVNPTHIAVALRYAPDECEAPYLVAKGRAADALALRRAAALAGIPVLRDVPLARALVHYDVGEEVPEELYRAAAAVLRLAFEAQGRDAGPAGRTGWSG